MPEISLVMFCVGLSYSDQNFQGHVLSVSPGYPHGGGQPDLGASIEHLNTQQHQSHLYRVISPALHVIRTGSSPRGSSRESKAIKKRALEHCYLSGNRDNDRPEDRLWNRTEATFNRSELVCVHIILSI